MRLHLKSLNSIIICIILSACGNMGDNNSRSFFVSQTSFIEELKKNYPCRGSNSRFSDIHLYSTEFQHASNYNGKLPRVEIHNMKIGLQSKALKSGHINGDLGEFYVGKTLSGNNLLFIGEVSGGDQAGYNMILSLCPSYERPAGQKVHLFKIGPAQFIQINPEETRCDYKKVVTASFLFFVGTKEHGLTFNGLNCH